MPENRTVADALHEATHRVPGVPEHQDRPKGHQGTNRHGRSLQNRRRENRPPQNRSAAHQRAPRVLVGWQNRIAGLFARKTG